MPSGVASTPRTVARGDVALHGKRILVVEDEPLIAMEIVATLQEAGCAVAGPTANVAAAVALVEAGCDGALLDANLSGEPVGELAATLTRAGVPFAFVTGYDSEALPPPFRSAPLLRKPFTSDRLVATVTALFARRDFPEGRVVSFERPAAGRDSI
jgi:DNA-binding response OmpR family regulator